MATNPILAPTGRAKPACVSLMTRVDAAARAAKLGDCISRCTDPATVEAVGRLLSVVTDELCGRRPQCGQVVRHG